MSDFAINTTEATLSVGSAGTGTATTRVYTEYGAFYKGAPIGNTYLRDRSPVVQYIADGIGVGNEAADYEVRERHVAVTEVRSAWEVSR